VSWRLGSSKLGVDRRRLDIEGILREARIGFEAAPPWQAALRPAEAYFEGIPPSFKDATWRANATGIPVCQFTCSRSLATALSPLLQIIVEPVPYFVPLARAEMERAHYLTLMRHVGAFTGSMSTDICETIWRDFPDLAPEGWPALRAGPSNSAAIK
jgi:hypothetical protein